MYPEQYLTNENWGKRLWDETAGSRTPDGHPCVCAVPPRHLPLRKFRNRHDDDRWPINKSCKYQSKKLDLSVPETTERQTIMSDLSVFWQSRPRSAYIYMEASLHFSLFICKLCEGREISESCFFGPGSVPGLHRSTHRVTIISA